MSFLRFFTLLTFVSAYFNVHSQEFSDLKYDYSSRIDDYLYTNTDSALYYSQKLFQLGIEYQDSLTIAEGLEFIGNCYFYQNNIEQALNQYNEACAIYEALGDSTYMGLIYANYGNIYSELGQFSKCLTYYNKSEKLLQNHSKYPEDLALLYYNMAQVFLDLNDISNLEKYISKSKEILSKENIEFLNPALNNTESDLAIRQLRLDTAEKFALKALDGGKSLKNLIAQISAFNNLGTISYKKGKLTEAIHFQDSAVHLAKNYGDRVICAIQQSTLASYYLDAGNLIAADSLAQRSYDIAKKLNSLLLLKKTSLILARVLEVKGDYQGSLQLYKVYTQAKDSLQGFELSENILKSENLLSEQKNIRLKADAEILKANNSQNQLKINAAIIGLVLCILIIILLTFILYSRRNAVIALNGKQSLIDEKSRELTLKNDELERMNRAKDKLFSIITHDLRQPFNQISCFIQILEHTPEIDDSLKELIAEIKESTNHTLFAMNNLLIWSKSQFLNVKTDPEKIRIADLVNSVLNEMKASLTEKKLSVNLAVDPSEIVYADRNHMEIIFRNILSNAVKFSPIEAPLNISIRRIENRVEISFKDKGKGMTKEEVERLFDAESHFSTPGTLNEKGSGLGMLIVSEFVKENNGTINVSSEKNIGTTFKVTLPAS